MKKQQVHNIYLTINSLATGGAEKQCLLLANLLKEDFNVKVIIIDDYPVHGKYLEYLNKNEIKYTFLKGSILQKIKTLRTSLIRDNTDLIFSYLPRDILISAIASRGIVRIHIGGIRNALMEKSKIKILRFVHNHLLRASISNCNSGKEFFSHHGLNNNKIFVIPNGIKIDTAPLKRPITNTLTISTFGRLVEQKDFETAIKSFAYFKSQWQAAEIDVKLQIVGNGPLKEQLLNQIINLGLENNVSVMDHAEDLASILVHTDIYLCTSIFEGVSNAIMEAMAHSLPIVATDAGDNKLLVHHKVNGFVEACKDYIGIGNALSALATDYQKRLTFGHKSYEILKQDYDLPVFKGRYLNFIEKIQ